MEKDNVTVRLTHDPSIHSCLRTPMSAAVSACVTCPTWPLTGDCHADIRHGSGLAAASPIHLFQISSIISDILTSPWEKVENVTERGTKSRVLRQGPHKSSAIIFRRGWIGCKVLAAAGHWWSKLSFLVPLLGNVLVPRSELSFIVTRTRHQKMGVSREIYWLLGQLRL